MTREEILDTNYGTHLINILDYDKLSPKDEILNQIFDWWRKEGINKYLEIKAKNQGEQKATFKESGAMVITKYKELTGK